jgi:hypothetical protein
MIKCYGFRPMKKEKRKIIDKINPKVLLLLALAPPGSQVGLPLDRLRPGILSAICHLGGACIFACYLP